MKPTLLEPEKIEVEMYVTVHSWKIDDERGAPAEEMAAHGEHIPEDVTQMLNEVAVTHPLGKERSYCGAVLKVEGVELPYVSVKCLNGSSKSKIVLDIRECKLMKLSTEFVNSVLSIT